MNHRGVFWPKLLVGILPAVACFSALALAQQSGAPLSEERERALQPRDSFQECGACPEMVVVPAGSFTMGSPLSEKNRGDDETPQHRVTLANRFAAGKFEVTLDQFTAFVKETGYDAGSECYTLVGRNVEKRSGRSFRNPEFSQTGSHPAACLNWNDAKAYMAWLSRKTGKTYRLLTEAEWEYAARAGTSTRYSFGDDESAVCNYANGLDRTASLDIVLSNALSARMFASCSDGYAYTAPVGSFRANALGLYDTLGNVQEWTEDCYHEVYGYLGAPADGSAWIAGNCSLRVLRGGAWNNLTTVLRTAGRSASSPDRRYSNYGLRVARTLEP